MNIEDFTSEEIIMTNFLNKINAYMNDNDRGPGHSIGNSLLYGMIILSLTHILPLIVILILIVGNFARVAYQELVIENWKEKLKKHPADEGDFYFDCIMRPLASAFFAVWFGYMPEWSWPLGAIITFILAFKKKSQWPLIIFWK